jgi:hypothetical protein
MTFLGLWWRHFLVKNS